MITEGYFSLFLTEALCYDPSSEQSRQEDSGVIAYIFMQNYQKLSQIITKYSLLSKALYMYISLINILYYLPFSLPLDPMDMSDFTPTLLVTSETKISNFIV